jgi:hypothetical protein
VAFFPDSSISSFYTGRSFGPAIESATNLRNGALRARHSGEYWSEVNGGTPVGVGAGALALPIVGGSMSAFVRTAMTAAIAPIQEGREISGSTSASFTVTPAGLLLTALLSGSASITFTVANANLGAAVGISGSTSFSITPSAPILGALAGVSGNAAMIVSSSATLTGYGALSGNITPYTELSPQSLASSVWGAVATQFNEAGTMGNKLNSAASGGVDLSAMADAVRTNLQAELLRIVELAQIHGLVVGTDLVVTPTDRTAGSVAQTIATAGDTVTVSRNP